MQREQNTEGVGQVLTSRSTCIKNVVGNFFGWKWKGKGGRKNGGKTSGGSVEWAQLHSRVKVSHKHPIRRSSSQQFGEMCKGGWCVIVAEHCRRLIKYSQRQSEPMQPAGRASAVCLAARPSRLSPCFSRRELLLCRHHRQSSTAASWWALPPHLKTHLSHRHRQSRQRIRSRRRRRRTWIELCPGSIGTRCEVRQIVEFWFC